MQISSCAYDGDHLRMSTLPRQPWTYAHVAHEIVDFSKYRRDRPLNAAMFKVRMRQAPYWSEAVVNQHACKHCERLNRSRPKGTPAIPCIVRSNVGNDRCAVCILAQVSPSSCGLQSTSRDSCSANSSSSSLLSRLSVDTQDTLVAEPQGGDGRAEDQKDVVNVNEKSCSAGESFDLNGSVEMLVDKLNEMLEKQQEEIRQLKEERNELRRRNEEFQKDRKQCTLTSQKRDRAYCDMERGYTKLRKLVAEFERPGIRLKVQAEAKPEIHTTAKEEGDGPLQ